MGSATKYQACLYFINTITALSGAALVAVCIRALVSNESPAIASWLLPLGIAFGGAVLIISLCGCYGAKRAPEHIVTDSCNFSLWFYMTMLLLSIVISVLLTVTFFILMDTMNTAKDGTNNDAVNRFDDNFIEWTRDHPGSWYDLQNELDCCGYQTNTGDTATGPQCGSGAGACRPTILDRTEEQGLIIGIVAAVFALMQIVALIASGCLLCGYHRANNVQLSRV